MAIIIIDVDNTIIDQDSRKLRILKETLRLDSLDINEIRKSFDLEGFLINKDLKNTFWNDFFSSKYNTVEYLNPIPWSQWAIQKIAEKGYKIIFISGRPIRNDSEENEFKDTLINFGFYKEGMEIIVMRVEKSFDDPGKADDAMKEFKEIQIEKICKTAQEPIIGIGDTPDDISVYSKFEIYSLLFRNYFSAKDVIDITGLSKFEFLEIQSWRDVPLVIESLCGSEETFDEIIKIHIGQYSSYLGDLDQKNNIQLVISFFVGTALLWLWSKEMPGANTSFVALIISGLCGVFLSILFSIWGYASRYSRGVHSGQIIKGKFLKDLASILLGRRIIHEKSATEDAIVLRKMSTQKKKMAHLIFCKERYDAIDPVIARNELLYDLRSINYQKIYPEYLARTFLIIALFIALITFLIHPFMVQSTRTRDNTQPEKVEYFMNPERVVLRVESLPPKSNPITRHTSIINPNKSNIYEFKYEITGEKAKKKEGKLFLEAKS